MDRTPKSSYLFGCRRSATLSVKQPGRASDRLGAEVNNFANLCLGVVE